MLICSAVLPPPVHGQSLVNAWVRDVLVRVGIPHIWVDTSPGAGGGGSLQYHTRRIAQVIVSAWNLFRFCCHPGRRFYTVFESGYGIIYNFILITVSRFLGFSIILHHHTSAHAVSRSPRFKLLVLVAGARCMHIVLTDGMRDDLRRLYGVNAVTLSNWIVVKECLNERTEVASDVEGAVRRVGYIANISESKGFVDFCEIVQVGLNIDPNLEIWIAGPIGDTASAQALKSLLERDLNRIKYWGAVAGQQKEDFFAGLNFLLFPTRYRYEAAPLVVLEALLRNIAVFASDRGYIKDLLPPDWVFGDVEQMKKEFKSWIYSKDDKSSSGLTKQETTLQEWKKILDENSKTQLGDFLSVIRPPGLFTGRSQT